MSLDEREYDRLSRDLTIAAAEQERAERREMQRQLRGRPSYRWLVVAFLAGWWLVMTHGCLCLGPCC
jgi:hypothetical protein